MSSKIQNERKRQQIWVIKFKKFPFKINNYHYFLKIQFTPLNKRLSQLFITLLLAIMVTFIIFSIPFLNSFTQSYVIHLSDLRMPVAFFYFFNVIAIPIRINDIKSISFARFFLTDEEQQNITSNLRRILKNMTLLTMTYQKQNPTHLVQVFNFLVVKHY